MRGSDEFLAQPPSRPNMHQTSDELEFGSHVERYRRELQVHCYRMLGSYDDSEDLVQETFLRAWRGRATFQGRASVRTWLYRIATNACLDALDRRPRRVMPPDLVAAADPAAVPAPPPPDIPWVTPYPDRLLDTIASGDEAPESEVVSRETIELAFIAAMQHLPTRQRAVLILRDILGWSANESAGLLAMSVPALNSALQRARGTLKEHLPPRRLDWAAAADPTGDERILLQRFMAAHETADVAAIAAILREDARMVMPSLGNWYDGRDAIATAMELGFAMLEGAEFRMVPTGANRQPAVAFYLRAANETEFRGFLLNVLRIEAVEIVEIAGYGAEVFPAFGLPATLQ